nr:hypothetical protein [Tanacetum cinerariifolium]
MNNEMPATWRAAEIVSGDRGAYNVTYDGYKGAETVPRKFVRPCPPAISLQSWVSGDIVEVFDENSWKIATVLKVLKGGRFLVRLHGFAHEMKVQKMNVRTRQSWRDGQWVPVGKIAGSYGDMKTKIGQEEDDSIRMCNDARLQESYSKQRAIRLKRATIGGIHLLLPKIETRIWFCCLSNGKSSGMFQHRFATDKTASHDHAGDDYHDKDACCIRRHYLETWFPSYRKLMLTRLKMSIRFHAT